MSQSRRALVALLVAVVGGASCNRETPTSPSVVPIEYRVQGTVPTATIRYSNSLDGTTIVVSSLPWSVRVYSQPGFLTLDASSTFTGLLQVQILADGYIFRDASVNGSAPVTGVSGNFRGW